MVDHKLAGLNEISSLIPKGAELVTEFTVNTPSYGEGEGLTNLLSFFQRIHAGGINACTQFLELRNTLLVAI